MIKEKRIAFFGCKGITESCMKYFIDDIGPIDYLITISPEEGEINKVADYKDLSEFARFNDIDVYNAEQYSMRSKKDSEFIKNLDLDIAFVIGWQRLIPVNILNVIKTGVFGMHGSAYDLPKGRGRSPMNWSLILNRNQFYTNLFKYENNVDGGDILDSQKFDINEFDTIETLHFKNMISMSRLIYKNINDIIINDLKLRSQNNDVATYYPKREPYDGFIDWNLKTRDIYNLTRAVTKPFPGALSTIDGYLIKIWTLYPFTKSWKYADALNGEIVEVFYNKKFVVKTPDSCILVHDYDIKKKELITKGSILVGKDYRETYQKIESRYYEPIEECKKEITLKKMEGFYNTGSY